MCTIQAGIAYRCVASSLVIDIYSHGIAACVPRLADIAGDNTEEQGTLYQYASKIRLLCWPN